MIIYVSLELLFCMCVEMRDLRKKLRKGSISSQEHLVGFGPASFQGVCMNDVSFMEDLVQVNTFFYNIDILDAAKNGELAKRSVGKPFHAVQLLCYNSQNCFVSIINGFLKPIVAHGVTTFSIKLTAW